MSSNHITIIHIFNVNLIFSIWKPINRTKYSIISIRRLSLINSFFEFMPQAQGIIKIIIILGCFENLSKYKDDININPDKKIISQMVKSVIQLLIEIMRLTIFLYLKKNKKKTARHYLQMKILPKRLLDSPIYRGFINIDWRINT